MSEAKNVDVVRMTVLDRIEQSERHYKWAFIAAAVFEAAFLTAFLLLADLSNQTHVLLLIATIAIYTLVALSLMALGNYINRSTLRVLKAVELLADKISERK